MRVCSMPRGMLIDAQDAIVLSQDESRRCAQPMLDVVIACSARRPDMPLQSAHRTLRRRSWCVEVLPLAQNSSLVRERCSHGSLRDLCLSNEQQR